MSKPQPSGPAPIKVDNYLGTEFSLLDDYAIEKTLDTILLVEFADTAQSGEMTRNGIVIPIGQMTSKPWRLGKIIIAGTKCEQVKVGDYITFPNDKGIPVSNIKVKAGGEILTIKQAIFLDENRIFGVCVKA